MEGIPEEEVVNYMLFLEEISHGLPVELNTYIETMRNLEATQSTYLRSLKKIGLSKTNTNTSSLIDLLDNLYACSFKQIKPANEILNVLKSTYEGIVNRVDFNLETSKLIRIGFSAEEIVENSERQAGSNATGSTGHGKRGKAKVNQADNIVDYTFYKDDNFSFDLIEDESDDNLLFKTLSNPIATSQMNQANKRKRNQQQTAPVSAASSATLSNATSSATTINNNNNSNTSKSIVKKKRGRYNTSNHSNQPPTNSGVLRRSKDDNEPTYCFCKQVSFGGMVACDSDECPYQWFHYGCVGLNVAPEGVWYCPECREKK